ncbi:MFS transporter [Thermodesulfobacteriota bacterium]
MGKGIAFDFISLMATSLIFGMVSSIIPPASTVAAGLSLSENRKGLAQGILMTTAGAGMVIATSISATILSPLLGGWKNVMFFYGVINIIISGLWLFTIKQTESNTTAVNTSLSAFLKPLLQIIRIKAVWLIGMVGFFYMAGVISMVGFLPLYLRGIGWMAAAADGALATFMAFGTIGAIPLTLLSDKIGRRKIFLLAAFLSAIVCMGFLTVVHNQIVWGLIIFAGVFNSMMPALLGTICFEEKTVEPQVIGMAISFTITLSHLGMIISAPIGNSLADIYYGLPFVFWAALVVLGLIFLAFLKETGWRANN